MKCSTCGHKYGSAEKYPHVCPTLKQWFADMTGPEDAWAREQYAAIVQAAKRLLALDPEDTNARFWATHQALNQALQDAGEL